MFGVGFIAVGLAVGTGELILWPYLTTRHGLSILWLALLGITLQYFINQEVGRHALATGESFYSSSAKVFAWLAPLWLFATVLLYVWPGWAGALGTILAELFGGSYVMWARVSLALVVAFTFLGRKAYPLFERAMKTLVIVFFALTATVSALTLGAGDILSFFRGLTHPEWLANMPDMNVLFGAMVFAGAGGLLNLCLSLWYRDKQAGMGAYAGRITNPLTGKTEAVATHGFSFPLTDGNLRTWRGWMRYLRLDQGILFWFLGGLTLLLLSMNAHAVLAPQGLIPQGVDIVVLQANVFGAHWGTLGHTFFLIAAFLILFSTLWTIVDAVARTVADIAFVNSRTGPFAKWADGLSHISAHHWYYGVVVGLAVVNMALLTFREPLFFIVASSVLGGFTMALYTPLLIYLNNKKLPKPLRPGWFTNLMLVLASLVYGAFTVITIVNFF
jgi:hypothetical protein